MQANQATCQHFSFSEKKKEKCFFSDPQTHKTHNYIKGKWLCVWPNLLILNELFLMVRPFTLSTLSLSVVFWEKRIGFRIRSVSARRGHLCGSPSINTCRTTRFSPLLSRLSLGLSRDPYNAICTFRFCKKHFPCFDPKKRNGYTVENERKEDAFGMEGAARFRAFCLFCIRTTYYNNKVH